MFVHVYLSEEICWEMVKTKNVRFKFPTKHIKGVSDYKPSAFMLWFMKYEVTVLVKTKTTWDLETTYSNLKNQIIIDSQF
jgi:hypothetical protein